MRSQREKVSGMGSKRNKKNKKAFINRYNYSAGFEFAHAHCALKH